MTERTSDPTSIGIVVAILVAIAASVAWLTAVMSVLQHGRLPVLDFFCPPCGAIHGVLIWLGLVSW